MGKAVLTHNAHNEKFIFTSCLHRFSRNGKNRHREKHFFGNGNGKSHFPFPSIPRGNPNETSCFPVRRTGTLLVIYKRECVFVCVWLEQNVWAVADVLGSGNFAW